MAEELERKDIDPNQINWDEHASYWDEYDDAKIYHDKLIKVIKQRVDFDNLNIMDFGCGTGLLIDQMTKKAKHIVAIDTSQKMIEVLQKKNYKNVLAVNSELNSNTIEEYKLNENKFDLIVAVSVCAFLPNYHEVLTLIKSLLKPGGIFMQWDWLQHPREPDFGYTEPMLRDAFAKADFRLESVSVPFSFEENEEKMDVIMAIGKR